MDTVTTKTVIDADGDVVLVISKDNTQHSIQVSSKVLSVSSKVVKAMFSNSFKKDIDLANSTSPVAISLPEDDPQAMLTFCKILHLDTRSLELSNDIDDFKKKFIVTDKYDTQYAYTFHGQIWLERYSDWIRNCAFTN